MRYTKILLLGVSALALAVGTAGAGLNPQNPGIGGSTAYIGASRSCVECHTRIQLSTTTAGAMNGTHFVTAGTTTADTRSGGGWTDAITGTAPRTGGQYFKTTAWPNPQAGRGSIFSKYGRATDNASLIAGTATDNTGAATGAQTAATLAASQIICESCHNVISNVAGGNNLLAPMTSATYTVNVGDTLQTVGWANADEATLCVGCHGFMYTTAVAAGQQPRYNDTRNTTDGTVRRGNNHVHYINGTKYAQNHHVMTGDMIDATRAGQGIYWADTLVKDTSAAGWGATGSATNTTFTAGTRGTMPQRATWLTDPGQVAANNKTKSTTATQLHCITCHASPHSGDVTTGASILRDTNAGGTGTALTAIARIGDGGRTWMGFDDLQYCNDCHTLK
jgi:cytochrome c553